MSIPNNVPESGNSLVGEWYERYYQPLYNRALFLLKSPEQAQDVVHDVFIKVLVTMPQLRPGSTIFSWLYRVVTNRAIDITRSSAYKTGCPLDENILASLDIEEETEKREDVTRALSRLTARQRRILLAFFEQGYARREVARHEGIAVDTTDQHLQRAKRAFKKHYQEVA